MFHKAMLVKHVEVPQRVSDTSSSALLFNNFRTDWMSFLAVTLFSRLPPAPLRVHDQHPPKAALVQD